MKKNSKRMISFYRIPLIYTLIFLMLSIIVNLIDQLQLFGSTSNFFLSHDVFAKSYFTLMIGSLITLITLSISLMMVVLTVYGSQFSPRTLQDFLSNKKTLNILGYFTGALIYGISSSFLQSRMDDHLVFLSPLIGVLLLIFSVLVFIVFINFVSKSVQINIYIQQLSQEILREVRAKEESILNNPLVRYKKDVVLPKVIEQNNMKIQSVTSGYLHTFDTDSLIKIAIDLDCIIIVKKQIGEYVFEGDELFELQGINKVEENVQVSILATIVIEQETSTYNSLGFGTKKLVDIALRAMSPSTNDSSTASFCIEQLGESLKGITTILAHTIYTDKDKNIKVIAKKNNFNRVLYDHFAQIRIYGFSDMTIVKSTLQALIRIAQNAEDTQNSDLWEFTKYLCVSIDFDNLHKYDYEYIISDLFEISKLTNSKDEFYTLFKK